MSHKVAEIINTSKNAATDWFAADIERIGEYGPQPVIHTIQLILATANSVVELHYDGDMAGAFNQKVALTFGAWYQFSIVMFQGTKYNIQHTTTNQNISCKISETAGVQL